MKAMIPLLAAALGSLLGAAVAPLAGQTAQFEVASVRVNSSGDAKELIQTQPGGRFTATNVTLRQLIRHAYQLQDARIAGGPVWLGRDRFDIVAKAEGAASRVPLMLRALLAERFALEVHTETRELPTYALVPARSDGALASQVQRSAGDCDAPDAGGRGADTPAPGSRPACGVRVLPGTITASGATLAELAAGLSTLVGRLVQDRSGRADRFDFTLRWTPDQISPGLERKARAMGLPPPDPEGPALFTAIREQLGLRLDAQKGPVDVLVIDRAERPKAN
jgi:bla regulator protein blaR1